MNLFSCVRHASVVASAVIAVTLSGCGGSSSMPQTAQQMTQETPQLQTAAGSVDPYFAWRRAAVQTALPGTGCYQATYPSYAWTAVACSRPPNILYPLPPSASVRAQGESAQNVGNGADFTADVKPRTMIESIGSFPVVTGVTSVTSVPNPIFPPGGGNNGVNSYSLQLNSYFFATTSCGTIKNCLGWEQFVFENPPGTSHGFLFIQDWLIPTVAGGLTGCPPNKGWTFVDGGCVQNSPLALEFTNISIKNLAKLEITGLAGTTSDSVFLSFGSTVFRANNIQSDAITHLRGHWFGSEFNVIGNGGGDILDFNAGSTVEVRLEADTGVITAPTCPVNTGTTGESNNLNFVHAPASPVKLAFPSILFTMSNRSGLGTRSCDAVAAI